MFPTIAACGIHENRDPQLGKCIIGRAALEAFQQLDVFLAEALASMIAVADFECT
jgi:hypothetical protein